MPLWKIETQSYLDLDTGVRSLRVTHTLDMLIAADQIVVFDLAFGSSYDPRVDPKSIMFEDSGRCTVSRSTLDTRFWTQVASDFYYICSSFACTSSSSTGVFRSGIPADYTAS
jgi:hypothetical protein